MSPAGQVRTLYEIPTGQSLCAAKMDKAGTTGKPACQPTGVIVYTGTE